jgi:ribosomal protein S18 acetylase RimI-like enzyme
VPLTLIKPSPEHIPELGRICYTAFKDLQDRHRNPLDFPSVQHARRVLGMLVARPEFYGVAAEIDGELAGSNFLAMMDEVAGVGPITVDPPFQGHDVGRQLMLDVIREGKARGYKRIRLVQEAINTGSISLYASLGFETRHGLAMMSPPPAESDDASVRPAALQDLESMADLCRRIYKVPRRDEIKLLLELGFPVFLRVRDGKLAGYLIPGLFGHGVMETEEDAVMLARQAARRVPEPVAVFSPLDEHPLFKAFLDARFRTMKLLNLMTMGPYELPDRVWMPSINY